MHYLTSTRFMWLHCYFGNLHYREIRQERREFHKTGLRDVLFCFVLYHDPRDESQASCRPLQRFKGMYHPISRFNKTRSRARSSLTKCIKFTQ